MNWISKKALIKKVREVEKAIDESGI